MKLLIAGATGFVGQALVKALHPQHDVTVLGRDLSLLRQRFADPIQKILWSSLADQDAKAYDAVINLCGQNIADARWNAAIKQQLIASRVETNKTLIDWAIAQQATPRFFSANAVGIYGMQDKNDPSALDENSPIDFEHPRDFLSEIGVRWQQALQPALDAGMSVTSLRFGVVLGRNAGMLKKLTPGFYLGLGSVLGDGQQVLSWIDVDDLVAAVLFLLERPQLTGAFNLCSPHPVTQAVFARTLASVIKRPLWLRMPAFAVRTLFGEMGDCLLLNGQLVLPTRLEEAQFQFRYPELSDALRHECS